jgi:hypothetical protein
MCTAFLQLVPLRIGYNIRVRQKEFFMFFSPRKRTFSPSTIAARPLKSGLRSKTTRIFSVVACISGIGSSVAEHESMSHIEWCRVFAPQGHTIS